ncbi:acyl-CoA synthetase FdrA [Gluconobacter wancherniae]|uniref:acyl-CoA synthetase FdrA n=1 Tax=Gluconobacter wancherniae TaxID=1307955 RepID=UPI001B8C907C|nr:acyl-CoA synthetase FdrA [Gluconobacter wancherniae]MBS1089710.1 acyl-CoA synthetase FdrA [Gluconobacter wancherniae]
MASRITVRPREYHDSVRLMRLSQALRQAPGVTEAMVMMATPNNAKILATSGFVSDVAGAAKPEDLVIAVVAESDEAAEQAIETAIGMLQQTAQTAGGKVQYRTLDAACAAKSEINFVCISLPGHYAGAEAELALKRGMNVFLFSDNIDLEEEKRLKQLALDNNRLLMGPDCGTAIINGAGIGFANAVSRGPVGIVAASGTGAQEISSLIDRMGVGISHVIGTGGRDLHHDIGGITMCQGLKLLADDPQTRIIVVTSKPPSDTARARVLETAAAIGKPVIFNFLGDARHADTPDASFCETLAETALVAARRVRVDAVLPSVADVDKDRFIAGARDGRRASQRYIRGLYAGGTLCYEALLMLGKRGIKSFSNLKHDEFAIGDLFSSRDNTIIDMGDDAYTQGRAHPMIDPTLRHQRIEQEAADPEVALLLLDLVIGYGAHANPADALAQTLKRAFTIAANDGRNLPVIVTICGTEGDIQGYARQVAQLREIGVLVAYNNCEAIDIAGRYLEAINA